MDKLKVFGKNIRVMLSKHQTVQMPKEGQPDAGLTKDYSQSPLHRFKKPGSKNYQNIYPPSSTLHLSNIPATVNEDDIKEAFTKNGFTVKAFKFFPWVPTRFPIDNRLNISLCCVCLCFLQKRQKNGPDPTAKHGGGCDSLDQDAQLPTIWIKSPEGLVFEVEYIMGPRAIVISK